MTTVRINDPSLLGLLVADLLDRPDVIAEAIEPDRVRISLLGSYNAQAMRLAIELRLRAWEAAQQSRGVGVRLELED